MSTVAEFEAGTEQGRAAEASDARAVMRGRLRELPGYLRSEIFGQEHVVAQFADALQVAECELVSPGRPRSMMLFLGPTGVGKTEACECASRFLYGTAAIAKINCSELDQPTSTVRLIGTGGPEDPEGILGMEIDMLNRKGGRIILLDEIEKAHPNVSKLLLQMEAAQVMLGNRRKMDLSPYHIICTSNLGTKLAARMAEQSFPRTYIEASIKNAAINFFSPEVLQRFDRMLIYNSLTREVVLKVANKFIDLTLRQLRAHGDFAGVTGINICGGVFEALAVEGFDLAGGARPMRRAVSNRILAAAKDYLLLHGVAEGELDLQLRTDGQRGLVFVRKESKS